MQVDRDSFNLKPSHAHANPCVNMDAHSNPRRALKSAQEQEDWRQHRNKRDRPYMLQRQRNKGVKDLRKWRERERNLSFTASERQVTSQ